MKNTLLIAIYLLFLNSIDCYSQEDTSFHLFKTFEGDIADAAIDNLNDIYLISSKGQIKKFSSSGDSVLYDQVKKFGRLYTLDVSNPLKLLLFYRDYGTIVILDRYLSTLATLDLPKYSILQPGAIGLAYDNNIWVFDAYDSRVKKIDLQGNILLQTAELRNVLNDTIAPQRIINDNGLVYLADSAHGIFVFDNYGSFKKKIYVKKWQSIAINNNYIISTKNETVSFYNTASFYQIDKRVPFFKPYFRSYTTANKLMTFSENSLHVYQHHY